MQIIVRRQTAFVVVSEDNGTRLLRPTALPVAAVESKPKRAPSAPKQCEHTTSSRAPTPKRTPMSEEFRVLHGSNRGRGNRRQLREMCNAIVVHRHFV